MGARKRIRSEQIKEASKKVFAAQLRNCPSSPRKMRLVADLIRGVDVESALHILKNTHKEPSKDLHKLLLSAIANWQAKNEGARIEESHLYVKEVYVDSGRQLKRVRPAPQGRAYRIRKRSNHITLLLDSMKEVVDKPVKEKKKVLETANV
ncbi:MAG: 50S ribosomal protein L22 [Bacteroidetes bacterium]|nr:50S ribosomal protein L22 [Bacteroidota bacterium]